MGNGDVDEIIGPPGFELSGVDDDILEEGSCEIDGKLGEVEML